ncbi:MAG: hypothetical protein IT430_03535 [Phycisphaerales bacterium]|nr:hypothetical protein [Phycisphaerales bacterium]
MTDQRGCRAACAELQIAWFVCTMGVLLAAARPAEAQRDWYISASNGGGKVGTVENPASDLGNIVSRLSAGDRVFIAGGEYPGRSSSGVDEIGVPVEIYGGWDEAFTTRDPWGERPTIFTGDNKSSNAKAQYRLIIDASRFESTEPMSLVVDGIIFDNAGRNRYTNDGAKIARRANPADGENQSPEAGGLRIHSGRHAKVTIRNCLVINTAPTQGAFSLWGHEGAVFTIENNAAINNTGFGFALHSIWHPRDGRGIPVFTMSRNSSLFTEKHDAYGTIGGSGLRLESDTEVVLNSNLFAFNDVYAIDNASQSRKVSMSGNRFGPSLKGDYMEFDTTIDVDAIADESEHVYDAQDNERADPEVKELGDWADRYLSRVVIDRNAEEGQEEAPDTPSNRMRRLLGQNALGHDVKLDSDCWLPRLGVEAALRVARSRLGLENCGCAAPASPVDPR